MSKKYGNTAKILGVSLNSTSLTEVISILPQAVEKREKLLVVTPNPEFLVYGQQCPWFRRILNSADLAVPDGIGLVLLSRFNVVRGGTSLRRVAGADLTAALLKEADSKGWRVGIVGARRGVRNERIKLIRELVIRYPGAKISALEDTPGWQNQEWEIIFACQGMGEQEKWLVEHKNKVNGCLFMAIGGSLDYLTGFSVRAPAWLRTIGLEWLWRALQHPAHLKRVFTATVVFPLLVVKEKLSPQK